jgi:beta-lactamase class A
MKIRLKMFKGWTVLSLIILGAVLGHFGGAGCHLNYPDARKSRELLKAEKANWSDLRQVLADQIGRFNGEAAVVIKDLDRGWEISFNRERLFPSASLVKIAIMAAAFLEADRGRINLGNSIVLKESDKLGGSGILKNVSAGTVFSIGRLIGLMIYDSDNTATNILTGLIGIERLNNSFKELGLKDTNLARKVADYKLRDRGVENYTSAADMAGLLEKIYRGSLGAEHISHKSISILKLVRSNDRIPRYLPPEITVAHKTGLEKGVCHDAGIIFTERGDFIIAVLTTHSDPNSILAKEFIAQLALHLYSYLSGQHR